MGETIQYIGEHLWIGQVGQFLIYLSFITALLSFASYTWGTNAKETLIESNWKKMGRSAFLIHGLSVFAIIGLIFYMMINKYYEYEYVWGHVSDDLPFRYIFSAFWEGQEGSFLLWLFWHVVLGFILIKTSKKWEQPVMAVVALAQTFFMFFLLGLYFGVDDMRIGASPFMLLRDVHYAPIFNTPTYLETVKGTGLNPLLQNYWMTIHPPTLFLGFASTIVPCAFAVAGLWKGEHKAWMRPALPWALFSGAILGTGILMGGVWAYEALSFGGYWAWDPVENASLVPWITLIAGIHTTLIARSTGYSIKSSYFFYMLTFFLIVYSTFLTRSGILGETSVHAFTEMGLEWQLILFLAVLALLGITLFVRRLKTIPAPAKEESAYSKEFWMFVGSLVLLFSAGLITATTSIPVWNAIFGTKIAPPEDVVAHHNNFQLWIGILVALLSGVAQFLFYRRTNFDEKASSLFKRNILISTLLTVLITVPVMYFSGIQAWQYWLLVGAGIFSILTNTSYIFSVLKGNIKIAGSAISHIGFGLMLIGVVFSGALKYALADPFASSELSGILGGLNKQTNKNILVPFGKTLELTNGFTVSYDSSWVEYNAQVFRLTFEKKDEKGVVVDRFHTTPNVLREALPNGNFKFKAANPNTKHYIHRDVFTLAVPDWAFEDPEATPKQDTSPWKPISIAIGDTFYTSHNYVIFKGFDKNMPQHADYTFEEGDIPITALLEIRAMGSEEIIAAKAIYYIRGNMQFSIPLTLEEEGLEFKLASIRPNDKKVVFELKDKEPKRTYVVVQALIFPGINLVWVGTIMMMFGLLMAMIQRRLKSNSN